MGFKQVFFKWTFETYAFLLNWKINNYPPPESPPTLNKQNTDSSKERTDANSRVKVQVGEEVLSLGVPDLSPPLENFSLLGPLKVLHLVCLQSLFLYKWGDQSERIQGDIPMFWENVSKDRWEFLNRITVVILGR